ncbi:KTSC domain-containing protein [Oscillochloris sp. ZM17-4]|uniref:KTSC domain-containing protein n=1 Tax=Oscillochloris sp. ZM17-4 TaxID=2866714 RepID=UPI001C73A312|nr:KTSC domain-containing protein [Oscillochloris sp. ZM17-4]MBX0330027.1 KTSC domain-containing protein [Oscillochloris sp. ZM17-4]
MHTVAIFQHANVAAQMITGRAPRFEIVVDGQVAKSVPATRRWQSEQAAVLDEAAELAGVVLAADKVVVRDARMATKLHKVSSSFIALIGYRAARRELTVVFKSGHAFIYTDVSLAEFNKLRTARSVGKAYNAIVRKVKAGFEIAKAA